MNKKSLNTTMITAQNSIKKNALKTKTLIINLGCASQLTLGNGGNTNEGRPRQAMLLS